MRFFKTIYLSVAMKRTPYPQRLQKKLLDWQQESLFFNAEEYFEQLISELEQAKISIDLECYYLAQDKIGVRIIDALLRASKRGVKVRGLVDGLGSQDWIIENSPLLKKQSANQSILQFKIYHLLPWQITHFQHKGKTKSMISRLIGLFTRINKRDHRKLCIIDTESAWTGSINFTEKHLFHPTNDKNWLDCGVNVRGECVKKLSENFGDIWRANHRKLIGELDLPFRTNNNILKRQIKNYELVRLIRSSQSRVWIITAYLAPSRQIVTALKKAKKNRCDVKIIISSQSDVPFFPLVSSVYYRELLSAGIEIFEYEESIIHAKETLIDELLIVGSSNLNHRSFFHDLELDLFLRKPYTRQLMKEQFNQLLVNSKPVDLKNLEHNNWKKRFIGKVVWWIRYWL